MLSHISPIISFIWTKFHEDDHHLSRSIIVISGCCWIPQGWGRRLQEVHNYQLRQSETRYQWEKAKRWRMKYKITEKRFHGRLRIGNRPKRRAELFIACLMWPTTHVEEAAAVASAVYFNLSRPPATHPDSPSSIPQASFPSQNNFSSTPTHCATKSRKSSDRNCMTYTNYDSTENQLGSGT